MKIALLTLTTPEFKGGVEKFNCYLTDSLTRGGHEVELFAFSSIILSPLDRALLSAWQRTPYSGIFKAHIMARHFRKREAEFDLAIANDFFGIFLEKKHILVSHGYFGDVFDCMRHKIPFYYWLWGQELGRVQRISLRRADYVVTPCYRNFNYMKEHDMRVDAVIEHGIDTDFYSRKNKSAAKKYIGELSLPENFLLYVGSNAPWKNIEMVEKASEEYDVVAVSKKAGHARGMKYIQNVEEKNMPAIYSCAEILLHPSLHEGFGYSVAEAMSCGTPPIFTMTGFGPEINKRIPEIIVKNPDNYQEIKRRIEHTVANRKEISRKCRDFIVERYNLEDWGKKWLELVENV